MSQVVESAEVLTLEEAAAFLRVSSDAVLRLALQQVLPGRQIEGQWRFLRTALADWLREKSPKAVLLSQAGALARTNRCHRYATRSTRIVVDPRRKKADAPSGR